MSSASITLNVSRNLFFSEGAIYFDIVLCENVIGYVELTDRDPLSRRAAVGIEISQHYRRQGYALQALHLVQEIASQSLNLHQIYADILLSNKPSMALFEKAGYSRCATMKEWTFDEDEGYLDTSRWQLILN